MYLFGENDISVLRAIPIGFFFISKREPREKTITVG
jgi:hypothetical protein